MTGDIDFIWLEILLFRLLRIVFSYEWVYHFHIIGYIAFISSGISHSCVLGYRFYMIVYFAFIWLYILLSYDWGYRYMWLWILGMIGDIGIAFTRFYVVLWYGWGYNIYTSKNIDPIWLGVKRFLMIRNIGVIILAMCFHVVWYIALMRLGKLLYLPLLT